MKKKVVRKRHPGTAEVGTLWVIALLRVLPLLQIHHKEGVVAAVAAPHILTIMAPRTCTHALISYPRHLTMPSLPDSSGGRSATCGGVMTETSQSYMGL